MIKQLNINTKNSLNKWHLLTLGLSHNVGKLVSKDNKDMRNTRISGYGRQFPIVWKAMRGTQMYLFNSKVY